MRVAPVSNSDQAVALTLALDVGSGGCDAWLRVCRAGLDAGDQP
jgi:hypothetical protein